jgi:hypothetical protein
VADERTLYERLIELAVFVPIGIAASVVEELPALAEKGRERLNKQLRVARMVGKLTVVQAQRQVGKVTGSAPPRAAGPPKPGAARAEAAGQSPSTGGRRSQAAPAPAVSAPRGRPDGDVQATPASGEATAPDDAAAAGLAAEPPDVLSLPIPGYDTLAASQVVQRLGSLRADELDAVRRYEVATRGRRTILHRIAQLSSSDGRASA